MLRRTRRPAAPAGVSDHAKRGGEVDLVLLFLADYFLQFFGQRKFPKRIVSVFRFLRSQSAKNEIQKKMKYRCERSHLGYCVSPVT
jgi:hypothetical protein